MDEKINYALIGAFVFVITSSIFESILKGDYSRAIVSYSVIPIFLYITMLLVDGMAWSHNKLNPKDKYDRLKRPNILKFYIAWIPLLFSKKVKKWTYN